MAEEGPGVASDDGGLVIGGIPLDPSSHTILQYAGGDEGAAADLAAAINQLTGRVMHAVPDIAWYGPFVVAQGGGPPWGGEGVPPSWPHPRHHPCH